MCSADALWADALNKFSQLTPWVQVALPAIGAGAWLGMCHFLKEIVRLLVGAAVGRRTDKVL